MRFFKMQFLKKRLNTDDVDGGVRKRFDSNAPKTINCTKPIAFECIFSTLTLIDEDELERSVFTLKAEITNGIVKASYKSRNEGFAFTALPSFMEELQTVIADYDFAQFNGITYHVSGLPDMFGSSVSVSYESGEHIYSANNQDCFIPVEAMKKLMELYKKYNV
ncbi:MAG: hypothetical protein IJB76_01020 [Clostridia bacterium]|nr:hypothetical protein [Clostridia bacterium]